ncbi:hypothetical protein CLG85_018765, partial [Yangia mangrovi]|nr:hypothetical protein [Alloyangia mangrovi]
SFGEQANFKLRTFQGSRSQAYSYPSRALYVTHDQIEAMTLADRIVALDCGRIEQVGRPQELYRQPAKIFVAGVIGSPAMTFFDARLDTRDGRKVGVLKTGETVPISAPPQ